MIDAERPAASSPPVQGTRWGARARDWAELCAGFSRPAWEAVADATRLAAGTRVLDVGCGSGEFCRLAAARGATAAGIDAAPAMIELARRQAPGADLRLGAMEALPWPSGAFDVVTAFNAVQFAADPATAVAEARRVARPGGRVAICTWTRAQDSDLFSVYRPLASLHPHPPSGAPALGDPGVLERLLRHAGLEPQLAAEVAVPLELTDPATTARALLAAGPAAAAIEHAGEDAVRAALLRAAAPFRRSDGSYRFSNQFRYVIAAVPP